MYQQTASSLKAKGHICRGIGLYWKVNMSGLMGFSEIVELPSATNGPIGGGVVLQRLRLELLHVTQVYM